MSKHRLLLLALSCALAIQTCTGQFACPADFPGCECELVDKNDVRVHCTYEGEQGESSYHDVAIHSEDFVGVRCGSNYAWDHFLNGMLLADIDPIKTVILEQCRPLGAQDFRIIKQRLGLNHSIHELKYETLPQKLRAADLDFLTELKHLNLADNYLGKVDEDLLWGLPNLTELGLRSTYVNLPLGFFSHSKKLQALELSFNGIEELEPGVFDGLESINHISLWTNNLQELHPEVFRNLSTLRMLDINSNDLLELPVDVFADLKRLQALDLSSNQLATLPGGIFRNNIDLGSFKMSYNNREIESLPGGLLADFAFLTAVELKRDGLRSLPEDLLWNSASLATLDLSLNYLSLLPPRLLKDAVSLEQLNLAYNELTSIPEGFFSSAKELKVLDLSLNQFESINRTTLKALRQLEELNMEDNNLSFIHHDAFLMLEKLKIVKLANNQLTMYTDFIDLYGRLSPLRHNLQLEELYLSNNNVSELFSDWLFNCLQLRKLDLYNNSISALQSEDLQFMASNVDVNLRHNKLKSINLNRLEHMAVEYNMLSSGKRNIKVLLGENPFECNCDLYSLLRYALKKMKPEAYEYVQLELEAGRCSGPAYANGTKLTDLVLEDYRCKQDKPFFLSYDPCGPNGACECWFKPAYDLMEMNCAAKGLTQAPTYLDTRGASAISLNLRDNELAEQPDMTNWGYEKVAVLLLAGNKIASVDDSLVTPNLEFLDLRGNELTHLEPSFLGKLGSSASSLLNLTLSGNPWRCDCEARPFLEYAQSHAMVFPDLFNVSCANSSGAFIELGRSELCPFPHELLLGIAVGCALLFLLSTVLVALYFRYKLQLKIWLYSRNLCLCYITEAEVDEDKAYDAFVSYSHKDEEFVKSELLARLEAQPYPYSVCIHERDWLAGEWIPAQIERSVEQSRRTVIVLSRNFIDSVWSKIEFQAAHKQALRDKRARVIVVLLGDIEAHFAELDEELASYLKMYTYIKWGDPWFWQKLAYALPHRDKNTLHAIDRENKEIKRIEVMMNPSPDLSEVRSCC